MWVVCEPCKFSQFIYDVESTVKINLAEVTGVKVNHGAGYGLEILCTYGSKSFVDRLSKLVQDLHRDGRL